MATRSVIAVPEREARFFFAMACVMAAVVVIGFGGNVALGRVTFAQQAWYVHVHAFFFFGWMALYVAQSGLIAAGNVALHRRLGWLALAWVPAMVVLGIVMTVNGARYKPAPPELPVILILIMNIVIVLTFAAMVFTAIGLRRRTAVHRRLIYIGTSQLTSQAFGRIVPMFIAPGPAIGLFVTPCVMAFCVIGAVHDKWFHGRVHPLWWLGIAVQPAFLLVAGIVPATAPGIALLHLLLDGSPGATRIPVLP